MNDADKRAMEAHGITCAPRMLYYYKEFRYERLDDALRYAKLDAERERALAAV
jgi:hypothetical protein